jgi:hypothetical protein
MSCAPLRESGEVGKRGLCSKGNEVKGLEYHGVIIPPSCGHLASFIGQKEALGYWLVSCDEVEEIEMRLPSFLQEAANPSSTAQPSPTNHNFYNSNNISKVIANLSQYKRQYLGVTLLGGKKCIIINCFLPGDYPEFHANWLKKWVATCDGGYYYWVVHYYPEDRRFQYFAVNPVA